MGAGASAATKAAVTSASAEELVKLASALPEDAKAKLLGALKDGGEQAPAAAPAAAPTAAAETGKKVLLVVTSAAKLGDHDTGLWAEECTGPYYFFKDGGCAVTICSIDGGDVPIDQASLGENFKTANDSRMESEGWAPLKGTSKLADQDVKSFDILFFSGGHGTCVDFSTAAVGGVIGTAASAGKVVASVCHGPMALVHAEVDGAPLVKGKKVACFTNVEEEQVQLTGKVPFLLQDKMAELGATVVPADPWTDQAVRDGKLVTGQNPQSSVSVAKLALEAATEAPAAAPAAAPTAAAETGKKVLLVVTSAAKLGDHDTGLWAEECTGPYYFFKDGGCAVTVCSIDGGDVPIDQASLGENFKTGNDSRMESEGWAPLKGTSKLADQDVKSFDILFFSGGHGTCVDFSTAAVGGVIGTAASAGKVVASVCHGPMALVHAEVDGAPLVKGKKVACFTNVEEEQVQLTGKVPFLLQDKMAELGATVVPADPWTDQAVRDGKLVTGQNPQSSVSVAKLALEAATEAAAAPAAGKKLTALIMGPPGGGKGTLSKKLIKDFNFHHVSTGDMLRAQVREGTELGKEAKGYMDSGGLVPDKLIIDMVLAEVEKAGAERVLLDGFPRTAAQAETLSQTMKVDMALNLAVPIEEIIKRASGRWIHPASGRSFAYDYNPPKEEGKDDETGEPLVQRDDDKPEAVKKRLEGYDSQTKPLLDFYRNLGLLAEFDGSDHADLVAQDKRSDAIYKSLKPHVESKLA